MCSILHYGRQKTTCIAAVCSGPLWGPYGCFAHKGPCRGFGDLHVALHGMAHMVPCAPPLVGPTQISSEDSWSETPTCPRLCSRARATLKWLMGGSGKGIHLCFPPSRHFPGQGKMLETASQELLNKGRANKGVVKQQCPPTSLPLINSPIVS